MPEHSGPSVGSIDDVLAFFGLGQAQTAAYPLHGMANQSWRVRTATGAEVVVKFLVHQKEELVINEIAIQQQLHACNIFTPRYIQSPAGGYVYRSGGLAAVVAPLIVGVHPSSVSRKLAHSMGSMLARFHAGVRSLPVAHTGWLNRTAAAQTAAGGDHAAVKERALACMAAGDCMFAHGLPVGIIHGDFHIGNLLVRSPAGTQIVAMLDFEEAEENLLLVDLAFGLFGSHSLTYTKKRTWTIMHAFLDGYEAVRPLEPAEKSNLPLALRYVGGACSLWMVEHGHTAQADHNLAIADFLCTIDLRR